MHIRNCPHPNTRPAPSKKSGPRRRRAAAYMVVLSGAALSALFNTSSAFAAQTGNTEYLAADSIPTVIGNVTTWLIGILATLATLILTVGGVRYILAGGEVTTLNELVRIVAEVAGVQPPRLHLPVWPFWVAGAICETICAPLRIEPPLYRRRVDFYTKSRAFDITRARTEIGYAPRIGLREGVQRTLDWYRQHGWL